VAGRSSPTRGIGGSLVRQGQSDERVLLLTLPPTDHNARSRCPVASCGVDTGDLDVLTPKALQRPKCSREQDGQHGVWERVRSTAGRRHNLPVFNQESIKTEIYCL